MQSDDRESSDPSSQASVEGKDPEHKPLRREAVFMATERHRSALLAACCSLAGVGVGFGISQMASQSPSQQVTINQTLPRAELAAPSPQVQEVVTWLGVEVQSSDNAMPGAHVTEIVPGSPAEAAGLDVGDVIVRLGRVDIGSSSELVRAVRAEPPGTRVNVTTVNYQGERHEMRVVLEGIAPRDLRALHHQ